jgi:hypothetical protein
MYIKFRLKLGYFLKATGRSFPHFLLCVPRCLYVFHASVCFPYQFYLTIHIVFLALFSIVHDFHSSPNIINDNVLLIVL